ncbi:MAG: 30S ribosomal protein S16 [Candidatus Paceibacterota bacterium]|jgi:small subunit ribosomal protein S16
MLAIKLKRIGKKHQASFRVIVNEKRSKMQGESNDDLGWYNPHTGESKIDGEKVVAWMKKGARPTESMHNLLVHAGILKEHKIAVHVKAKAKTEEVAK